MKGRNVDHDGAHPFPLRYGLASGSAPIRSYGGTGDGPGLSRNQAVLECNLLRLWELTIIPIVSIVPMIPRRIPELLHYYLQIFTLIAEKNSPKGQRSKEEAGSGASPT